MDLHVHVQFILVVESSAALRTLKIVVRVGVVSTAIAEPRDAILATRVSISLAPLIGAELTTALVAVTIAANSPHGDLYSYCAKQRR
mmetsp:Transcript_777/g.1862  ORF Transcript_777/g.1862 Transcript_777/m.1862 type:complete len:87 (-) Transcript_777:47-307(-)